MGGIELFDGLSEQKSFFAEQRKVGPILVLNKKKIVHNWNEISYNTSSASREVFQILSVAN